MSDTIFALSSGQPPAAIGVVRISGPGAVDAAMALAGHLPPPRRAGLRRLRGEDGATIDHALILVFPGPDSATGEDLVELHCHGGRAVIGAVEHELARMQGLRMAEPGEFTRRSLTNGRIDLTEAEGLADLLVAETEGQRRAALQGSEGEVRRAVGRWVSALLILSAIVEAELDHGDEDDVVANGASIESIGRGASDLADAMGKILANPPVERLRDGLSVVLAGPPNAGKSSLLNRLAERDAAIVSPIAGTTRDRIEAAVSRAGHAYRLTDTAGLARDTDDAIERIGIDRAREAIAGADIVLWLGDDAPDAETGVPLILLHARSDETGRPVAPGGRLAVSALTGVGIGALWARIEELARARLPRLDMLVTNRRQRALIAAAEASLRAATHERDFILIAEHLRHARLSLDRITGTADTEAMLDTLFGRFCIGK